MPAAVGPSAALAARLASAHAFADADRDGYVTLAELAFVVRAAGFAPTEAELAALRAAAAATYGPRLSRDAVTVLVATLVAPAPAPAAAGVRRGLAALAALRAPPRRAPPAPPGTIALADAHALLTGGGDALSQGEFVALLRRARGAAGAAGAGAAASRDALSVAALLEAAHIRE
jgi:hypothetical protein